MEEWRPNPKQQLALESTCYEIGYGGARGGGKTDAGLAWLLYDREHPKLRALVIRRQSEDLKDWVDRAEQFYRPFGAVKKGQPGDFYWPKGAIFRTGHLKTADAYSKYVGHEYQRMLIEELNLIPSEDNYLKLISSCRSTIPDLPPQVFSNFNPSDAGFAWIKKRFRIKGTPTMPIFTKDEKTGLMRVFIPARLADNPYLSADPQYRSFLDGLPDGLREAWRDGSWDDPVIKGAYYTLELEQVKREGRIKLVPHDPQLKVHTVWDLGIDDAMCIAFVQRTSQETRVIDYYQAEGFGFDHYAAKLQQLQAEKKYVYGKHFAPHDANQREKQTGKTLVQFAETLGVKLEVVPSVPIQDGIQRARLMFPRLWVNEAACEQFLSGIRNYRKQWDENLLLYRPEPVHDWASHPADVLRYLALVEDQMTNAAPMPPPTTGLVKPFYPQIGT